MPVYHPLTEVMPAASMVTGAAVTAALGDQIRDNLVALYNGWWFRASKSTATTTGTGTVGAFVLDTISMSQTAEDEGSISLNTSTGAVTVHKTGIWAVGGHYNTSSSGTTYLVAVEATDSPGGLYVCQSVLDTGSGTSDICCSGGVEVTSGTATFRLMNYTSASLSVSANSRSPVLWAYWLGDRP